MKINPFFKQPIFVTGILLLLFSGFLFVVPQIFPSVQTDVTMGFFMFHYAITVMYFFAVLLAGRFKRGRNGLPLVIINLLLFFISAFSLNREMNLFHDSVEWLQILLIVSCINLLVMSLQMKVPNLLLWVQTFLLSISICLFTYYAIYLVPVYPFGLMGTIAIGIGLHAFVPLLLTIYAIKILRMQTRQEPVLNITFAIATTLVILGTSIFAWQWHVKMQKIEYVYNRATVPDQIGWPAWVEVMQEIPLTSFTEKIIKSDLVYTVADQENDFFNMPTLSWDEAKKHDPLVVVASLFSSDLSIPKDDRIQMLQARNDNTYATEQRLWSGNNLETVHLNTEVKIWPAMHLAYTEKTITVANRSSEKRWRGSQQEAIYIFQLPEGGVVSSLSLWIDGREVKSVLTTKGKAQKAYNTIVGVEVRDPSVVHWQEGNRVSVRVFPVMGNDARIFKMGITAPLPEVDGQIRYEQIQFQGPDARNATERMRIHLVESAGIKPMTVALKKQDDAQYVYDGKYRQDLMLSIPSQTITPQHFVTEGTTFELSDYKPSATPQSFSTLYADINAGWNKREWAALLANTGNRILKVYEEDWITVTPENGDDVFERLQKRPMTLFPFYAIKKEENALVISKSAGNTPSVSQIKNSSGFDALSAAASVGHQYFVYNLGQQPSLYISSLREMRLFHYAQGDMGKLVSYLSNNTFETDAENSNLVVYHDAGLQISRSEIPEVSTAPDHLLRLFAYSHIMQQGGLHMLANDSTAIALQEGNLGELAAYAHIVTPVSSMIVLESQKDYDRFDIDTNKKGLQNATMQNNGSVPEPHEWALIIIGCLLLIYYRFSHKFQFSWLKK